MSKLEARKRRHAKFFKKFKLTSQFLRLVVYRSNKDIYAQLIDDSKGATIASASSLKIKKGNLTEKAKNVGTEIAKQMKDKKIEKIAFDKNGFSYRGVIKTLAETVRAEGLNF